MRMRSMRSRALAILCVVILCPAAASAAIWQPLGPDGGTVLAVAFAPSDARVAYAGTAGGGVFRSRDGGSSWQAASTGLRGLRISSLAVGPRDPAAGSAGTGTGLYKTTSS